MAIKVDREERPDIDNLYMAVCQTMTGQGGRPLTVLLTPAVLNAFAGGMEIVLSRAADDPLLHEMIAEVRNLYLPGTAVLVNYAGAEGEQLRSLLPHLAGMQPVNGQAAATGKR
ncbi:DUF255 domain-containing protein [Paenibacillus physcomitrellae]|uniref:Spermatogenesis-associated protein 20-like TRX domain-containing protein n=1 Tax=Paenibacillus physcomitrellae TaxID=1619311 RepID=A0ABQ1FQV1_9BACL|nr:hypothetical protein GCM10010917_06940 [Paenibacillus physcomitrellae]